MPKRRMGGGHAPPPQDGLDGMVRKFLPEDHHVSMGIIGLYVSLYLISGLFSSKKKPVAETASSSTTASGTIPSVDSPDFDAWLSTPGNIEKALA
eukprot:CAMPEP_0174953904 /NCGR_PEP_ID=MMETSP0004_2-20121128/123_1 /TAXON_ID=420556 /ORGANISM="Ochromonas sp., Strain CCMP1393" /LENGTH=94 /DNA_ID=CAMNT_0016201649 /DNA_START=137 /DNA_END=421 /DNA_ORIENTATION=-